MTSVQSASVPASPIAAAVERIPINQDGVVGVVFQPATATHHFAVLLGGSYGGVPEAPARKLAENGICAFALGYFGAPGLPPGLVEVPLESVARGIEWFSEQYAGGEAVGLIGFSKGAELALVLAAQLGDRVSRTVAVAPSHAVWFGLKPNGPDPDRRATKSSWTSGGIGLPFLPSAPIGLPAASPGGLRTDVFFDLSGHAAAELDAARIAVERSAGPLLLLSGDDDHQWPATPMANDIEQRMKDAGRGDDVTNVIYPGAGHMFLMLEFMPPWWPGPTPLYDFGGSTAADQVAGKQAWQQSIAFLGDG